jgi:hypothetical protein
MSGCRTLDPENCKKDVGTESTTTSLYVAELPTGGVGFLTFFKGLVDGWEDWNGIFRAGWLGCAKRRVEVVGEVPSEIFGC